MILVKSFLTRVSYDCFKVMYAYLNEGDKVRECYRYLKMIVQAPICMMFFFHNIFIKRALLKKRFYLY